MKVAYNLLKIIPIKKIIKVGIYEN